MSQEFYVQPRASVGAEVDTNRDLVSSGPTTDAAGVAVAAGATVGLATPRTDTTLRPNVTFYDYPKLSESSVKSVLDFTSYYRTPRSQLGIYGQFSYADLYSSELATAEFNSLNPSLPTTPETGRISTTGTRTLLTAVPTFQFDLTRLLELQVNGVFQEVVYGGATSVNYNSYGYYQGNVALDWKYSPRADVSLGVGDSQESARDIDSITNGRAVTLIYNYQWSASYKGSLAVFGEQDDIRGPPLSALNNSHPAPAIQSTTNGVGATYTTSWKGQISDLQFTVGRTFTPNGAGGKFASDSAQLEYKYQVSPRTFFVGAAHYIRNTALSSLYDEGNYDYVTASLDLRWMINRTWFVSGGLEYLSVISPNVPNPVEDRIGASANNKLARISFGYEGLGRQY